MAFASDNRMGRLCRKRLHNHRKFASITRQDHVSMSRSSHFLPDGYTLSPRSRLKIFLGCQLVSIYKVEKVFTGPRLHADIDISWLPLRITLGIERIRRRIHRFLGRKQEVARQDNPRVNEPIALIAIPTYIRGLFFYTLGSCQRGRVI